MEQQILLRRTFKIDKMYYDQKTKNLKLKEYLLWSEGEKSCWREGNRVLVKVVAFHGKHKIADWREDTPNIVLQQPNTIVPVLKVKRQDWEGSRKTLHRNLLLPIGSQLPSPVPPLRHRVQPKKSELPNTQRKLSQVDNSQEEFDVDDISDGLIIHVGTRTTAGKTHIDQKEDIPHFSISTDGQESEESKGEDQTVEEE